MTSDIPYCYGRLQAYQPKVICMVAHAYRHGEGRDVDMRQTEILYRLAGNLGCEKANVAAKKLEEKE